MKLFLIIIVYVRLEKLKQKKKKIVYLILQVI